MKRTICLLFPALLILACKQESTKEVENRRPVQLVALTGSHEILADHTVFTDGVIITNLTQSTVELYEHYESIDQKNRYHDLMEFGGYCELVLSQFNREKRIKTVDINELKEQLLFITPTDSILITRIIFPENKAHFIQWKGKTPILEG